MVAKTRPSSRSTLFDLPGMATAFPVTVIYGPGEFIATNFSGQSVATIHLWTRDVLNAPRWCVAYVNGEQVDRHHRVRPGDRVEYIYPWGFKASDKELLSPAELMAWRRVTPNQYEELLRRGLPTRTGQDGSPLHRREDVYRWFAVVPSGAPNWITGDDIEETIRVWQPNYSQLLTANDALEILLNTHNLLDVLLPREIRGAEGA